MKLLKKTKAAFLYGKAIKSFLNNNYKKAIILFQEILELDPDDKDVRFTHYYLGRSHFAIKNNIQAREQMSIAYDLFVKKLASELNEKDVDYYKTLAKEYVLLLREVGEGKIAEAIKLEKNKLLSRP